MTAKENNASLEALALREGMAVFGVADMGPLQDILHDSLLGACQQLCYGISIGFRLSDPIIDGIVDRPTLIYKHHYKVANYMLDRAAAAIHSYITLKGCRALPIPASQVLDWEKNLGHLSHKAVAVQAGLGWIGRSALFVHPEHRARLRLATVLTDMPLEAGKPLENVGCGDCTACIEACPAGAISEQGYDRDRCAAKLKEFSKLPGIGQSICGVCVKTCPGAGACHPEPGRHARQAEG
jgi:epoxyqueuosine reductase QueG